MKFLITLLLVSSTLTLASEQCIFSSDNIDQSIDVVDTIQDYYEPEYGVKASQRIKELNSLHPLAQRVLRKMYELDGDYSSSVYEFLGTLDDLELKWIKLKLASKDDILAMSYGVGGGNGGYHYFKISEDQSLKLIASSFDGDIEFCAPKYYLNK